VLLLLVVQQHSGVHQMGQQEEEPAGQHQKS
jgi:hypothetical protein